MYKIMLGLSALSLAACSSEPGLLERHVEARGGETALAAVNAIEIEVHITEPTFEITGIYRAERPDNMRVDIFMEGERVFSEGLDDGDGWQMFADGSIAPTTEAGRDALMRGVFSNLYGFHEYASLGHEISEGGTTEIDGQRFEILQITMADGFEERFYLDPVTALIARARSEFALHPDLNPDEELHETRYDDYREVGGTIRPFHQETVDLRTGETVQTVRVTAVRINPDLEPDEFERPE